MPDRKRQHYVHQMHLKEWSEDEKNINFIRLNDGLSRPGPIKRQCQKDYFFGKDMVTDELVSLFEGPYKPQLERIVSSQRPPVKWSDDYIDLLMYMMVFSTKTKAEKSKAENLKTDVSDVVEEEGLLPPKKVEVPPHDAQISAALKIYPICTDLNMVLLIAGDDNEFITSDNPVVCYNPWLGHLNDGGHIGLAENGIIIFMPIDPKHLMDFYDGRRYQTRKETSGHIVLSTDSVQEVNALQIYSAEHTIYFRSNGDVIEGWVEKEVTIRSNSTYLPVIDKRSDHPGDYRISMNKQGPSRRLKLDFIQLRYCARQRDAAQKVIDNGNVARNPELVRATELFQHATWDLNYPVTEFRRFKRERNL